MKPATDKKAVHKAVGLFRVWGCHEWWVPDTRIKRNWKLVTCKNCLKKKTPSTGKELNGE